MPLAVNAFEFEVVTTDFLGISRTWHFTVIATDRKEVEEEIASVMSMHDEVENWKISRWIQEEKLADNSPMAIDYKDKGCHSYFTAN